MIYIYLHVALFLLFLPQLFDLTQRTHPKCLFFFFNDPATPEIYTLPLPDALPISCGFFTGKVRRQTASRSWKIAVFAPMPSASVTTATAVKPGFFSNCRKANLRSYMASPPWPWSDRKSTRLNSSHQIISYAVFCFK